MKTTERKFLVVILFVTIVSFAQNGTLDNTFDSDGKVMTVYEGYESDVESLAIQSDGKIIAAGTVFNHGSYSQFGLARYLIDGSLDPTFGIGGKVVGGFLQSKMSLNSIVLQPDNKILVAGIIYNNYSDSQFVLVRYNTNGTLDTTFGVGGIVIMNSVNIKTLTLQSDGKIIAAGFLFGNSSMKESLLIRYNKDGTLDTGFGVNGIATSSIGIENFGNDIVLQSDGKILLSGALYNNSGDYNTDFCITRFHNNGTIDNAFGTNGIVGINIDDVDEATSIKIQTDGKIVFVGFSYASGGTSSYSKLVRLLPNGNLDSTFGTGGMATTPVSVPFCKSKESVEIQNDGKIVIAGFYTNPLDINSIALARYQTNGVLDSNFGVNGLVVTSFGASTRSVANAILLQSDGKIVAGGESGPAFYGHHPNSVVLRYNAVVQLSNPELIAQKYTFSAYPNPVNQIVNLDFNLNESEELSIDLFDINGAKIANLIKGKAFQTGYHSQKLELPETLSKGIYFLNISNGSTASNVKIVKQ
jgi:uncharacterized delta-60 repeat protein